jgi:hypothetical protein
MDTNQDPDLCPVLVGQFNVFILGRHSDVLRKAYGDFFHSAKRDRDDCLGGSRQRCVGIMASLENTFHPNAMLVSPCDRKQQDTRANRYGCVARASHSCGSSTDHPKSDAANVVDAFFAAPEGGHDISAFHLGLPGHAI